MKVSFHSFNLQKIPQINFGERVTNNPIKTVETPCDVFESTNTDTTKLYEQFSKETSQVSAKDVEKIIKAMPELPRETVLLAMDKLTNFSNMNSIIGLKNKLEENNIGAIYGYEHFFENRERKYSYEVEVPIQQELLDNKIYFGDYGMTLDEYQENFNKDTVTRDRWEYIYDIQNSKTLPLGTVLNYFYKRHFPSSGKCPLEKGEKIGMVLDKIGVEALKNGFKKNPEIQEKYIDSFVPIYIENLENTYNIFEQHKDFAQETKKLASRIEAMKKTNPQMSKEKIADLILNGKNLKEIKKLGFSPVIIKTETTQNPTPQTIARKMSPPNPTKEEFDCAVEKSLKNSGYENDPKAKAFLIDYLKNNLHLYSPAKLSGNLIELKKKIEDDVKAHGKPVDKIYYNVVDTNKSFGLVNYMYQKANDIPENKFLYWNKTQSRHISEALLKLLPKDSTLVFLDDNMISGSCLLSESFPYQHEYSMGQTMKELKNIDFVFANLLTYDNVKERLNNEAKNYGRENKDRIVCVENEKMDMRDSQYFRTLHPDKMRIASTAILFPYMAPDNNAPNLRELFKLYYPQETFLSYPLSEVNFFPNCD